MKLLLDTHVLLWWLAGDAALTRNARMAVANEGNDIFVSAASAWEIATKHRLGKLPGAGELASDIGAALVAQGFVALPVTVLHGQAAGALPGLHRDPFDRMIVAQAMLEDMTVVSNERVFDSFAVRRLW